MGNLGAGELLLILIIVVPLTLFALIRITKNRKQTKVKRIKKTDE